MKPLIALILAIIITSAAHSASEKQMIDESKRAIKAGASSWLIIFINVSGSCVIKSMKATGYVDHVSK